MLLSPARKDAVAVAAHAGSGRPIRADPEKLILIGLTVLAAVPRFATLTSQSYWFDEAQAAHEMTLSFGGLMSTLGAQETSPPLYFALAWLWAKAFGTGEAGLRSLSALLGTAVVPIAYLSGRELVSRRAGLVAAGLAAVSPFMIWYSQEAREYMLLAASSGVSFLFFARSLREPSSRRLTWWAVSSGLALLTHFFAGFLVAPEAVWLLVAHRRRGTVAAVGAVVAVETALLPLALADTGHPLGWLTAFPLSTRIEQVPVSFAFNTLYRSSMINQSLLGTGVFAAVVVFLLVAGAGSRELRGAGVAAAIGAAAIVLPLVFALAGHDFFIARAVIPAWIPLAVAVGAACTAARARVAGGLLAAVLVVAFVAASSRIAGNPDYQRPDWRGIAGALGRPAGTRAVVVYEGALAIDPLKLYLAGTPWQQPAGPVSVGEVDVVGSPWQSPARPPAPGARLRSSRVVGGYLVDRFSLAAPWRLAPDEIAARADSLLAPAGSGSVVLVQHRF